MIRSVQPSKKKKPKPCLANLIWFETSWWQSRAASWWHRDGLLLPRTQTDTNCMSYQTWFRLLAMSQMYWRPTAGDQCTTYNAQTKPLLSLGRCCYCVQKWQRHRQTNIRPMHYTYRFRHSQCSVINKCIRFAWQVSVLPNVECLESLSVRAWSTVVIEMIGTTLRVTFSSRSQHDVDDAAITTYRRQLSTDGRQIHLASYLLVVLHIHTTYQPSLLLCHLHEGCTVLWWVSVCLLT